MPVQLQITNNLRLRSDGYGYIVQEKRTVKGKERWDLIGSYTSTNDALTALPEKMLLRSNKNLTTLPQIQDELNHWRNTIATATEMPASARVPMSRAKKTSSPMTQDPGSPRHAYPAREGHS